MPPSSVHFSGSVNLPDPETVMREISSRIPTAVRRMTDGETGGRNYWILFQIQKFLAMPELESVTTGQAYDTGGSQAPEDGTIPGGVRFRCSTRRGLRRSPARSCSRICRGSPRRMSPRCSPISIKPRRPSSRSLRGAVGRRGRVGLLEGVPQAQRDQAYFAPLRDLQAGAETELYFALAPYHPADQPHGTTAEQVKPIDVYVAQSPSGSRNWGICTECGMGRVAADDVPTLLDLHHEILNTPQRLA
jgi:hypothetical protein